jgi:hypothetical protein
MKLYFREATSGTKLIFKITSIIVTRVYVTHQHIRLSSQEDLQPSNEIIRKGSYYCEWVLRFTTSKIPSKLGKYGDKIIRFNMLCGIYSKPRKSNSNEICHIICNSFLSNSSTTTKIILEHLFSRYSNQ